MLLSKFPTGNKLTPTATPLHISQLVYQMLRYTFENQPDDFPFKWNSDVNLTGILFDTTFNKNGEMYGKKPLIICNSGGISTAPIMTGDVAYKDMFTSNSQKVTMINSSVQIRIISSKYSEVEILKNEIFNCLVALRTVLPGYTSITMIHQIIADEVRKFQLDENMYIGTCVLQYSAQYAWSHEVVQNILNGINVIINETFGFSI